MKARIKGTGKIVDVDYIEGDYLHTSDGLYLIAELEGIESDIDYWTRLEHQYAGMAMQGILGSEEIMMRINKMPIKEDKFGLVIAELSTNIALALVEKLKSSDL